METNEHFVLVVEDDPDGQDVVQRILRHHNIQFDAALDAEKALDLLAKRQYSFAVIDLALPGLDGWGLLKAIKGDPRMAALPCFAITAYHSADVAAKAIQSGFRAYFAKPLEATSFVRQIESFLDEAGA